MKVLTRDRVVPTISASVSWLTAITGSGFPSLPNCAIKRSTLAQTLLARIEELIDQILLDPSVASQNVRHEHLRELRLFVEHAHDCHLIEPHDDAVRHRHGRRQSQRLASQATLAEEIAVPVKGDDGLFPPLGYDVDLYLALSDVEDRIRRLSLGEDFLVLAIARYGPSPSTVLRKVFTLNGRFFFALATTSATTYRFRRIVI